MSFGGDAGSAVGKFILWTILLLMLAFFAFAALSSY